MLEAALNLLSRLEAVLSSSKSLAESKGLDIYYTRDVRFLEHAKSCFRLGYRENIQWVFDQMRNLSQGFASYSANQHEINETLDRLFVEVRDTLVQ